MFSKAERLAAYRQILFYTGKLCYTIIQGLFLLYTQQYPYKMKKPILLFAITCLALLYFTSCTGIAKITTAVSAKARVIRGAWKINLYTESQIDETYAFSGCMLTFEASGKIIAYKNGDKIMGNWAEDAILKRITINLDTKDPTLKKLNDHWNISNITKWKLSFENTNDPSNSLLQITCL